MTRHHNQLVVLAGATAVGKTTCAIQWAQQFNGEIINADSRQLYQHMDIGTAKPTKDEQLAAQHHLLDWVTPDQTITLAKYQQAAYAAIEDIQLRGKLPLLVGGTGLYITATLEGWTIPEVPPNPTLRADLEKRSNESLLAEIRELDPVTADRIDAQNPARLIRALEVCLETGRPFSELRQKSPPDYDILPFVLDMPREALYARADARVQAMLDAGWIAEVDHLQKSGYTANAPAMTALGYPQIRSVLAGDMTLDEAVTLIHRATRRYIRRQYTWIRGHEPVPGWRWIMAEDDAQSQIANWRRV